MPDQSEGFGGFMTDVMEGKTADWFYYYEPWDPEVPTNVYNSKSFQCGYHTSLKKIRLMIAANRTGKTAAAGVEAVIMMTGEIPHSMRYAKGHVTAIPRPHLDEGTDSIGFLNRIRWGFINPETDEWEPPQNKPEMERPDWPKNAPCGFIEGVGVFPREKISRRKGDSVWICTWKAVRDERWVKFMSDLIPKQFLDTRWNEDGYSIKSEKFRLTNGNEITFITYERGPERAQGAAPWAIFMDEEPKLRKFFTECDQRMISAGHDGWLSINFTPLFGLSWSYNDILQPYMNGENNEVEVFNASQFDCPYYSRSVIERRRKTYKPWEINARLYGIFSEMEGRPYYDFDKLNGTEQKRGWIQVFVPRYTMCQFIPQAEAYVLRDLLGLPVVKTRCSAKDEHKGYWEIYEDEFYEDGAYYLTCDTAEGAEDEEDASDRNAADIFRLPMDTEDPSWPVHVAAMRTAMPTLSFAREVWYAAQFYNYALIVPEITGEHGATLATEIREYPFIYQTTEIRDKTHKPKTVWGFDTTKKTRNPLFDAVGDYIDDHDDVKCIRSFDLLSECASLIYGKNGRPDHPKRGTSDCVVVFGIGLYVYLNNRNQIHCNRAFGEEFRPVEQDTRWHQVGQAIDPKRQPLGKRMKPVGQIRMKRNFI